MSSSPLQQEIQLVQISNCCSPRNVISLATQIVQNIHRDGVVQVTVSSEIQRIIDQLSSVENVNVTKAFAVEKIGECIPVRCIVIDSIIADLLLVEDEPLISIETNRKWNDAGAFSVYKIVRDCCIFIIVIRFGCEVEWNVPASVIVNNPFFRYSVIALLCNTELSADIISSDMYDWITFLSLPRSKSSRKVRIDKSFQRNCRFKSCKQFI